MLFVHTILTFSFSAVISITEFLHIKNLSQIKLINVCLIFILHKAVSCIHYNPTFNKYFSVF